MTDTLAPEFNLRLAGEPAPTALRGSVSALRWETAFEGADRVELTIANHDLRWLDHAALRLHTPLELTIGYAPQPLERVFGGTIVSHSAAFPNGSAPTLVVAAQDARGRLQTGTRSRGFAVDIPMVGQEPIPDIAVASHVSADNGLVPIFEPVGAALSVLLGGVDVIGAIVDADGAQRAVRRQDAETDHEFLKRIALENGWELLIDHHGPLGGSQLRFFSPLDHLAANVVLGWGQSLLDFSPHISTIGDLVSITVPVWVSRLKQQLVVTVRWNWDDASLDIEVRPGEAEPEVRGATGKILISEPATAFTAPRKILAHLLPRLHERQTATATTIGDPRIVPGAVVQVEGVGEQFGGLYRITSATHSLDGSGYRTSFEARKELWFGSIPRPAQGAIPIRLTSPLTA